MNSTRQLASRILERLDSIPSGFRNLDKDALLSDIRDLYDQAMELETIQPSTVKEVAAIAEKQVAVEPIKKNAPKPKPVSESTQVPAAKAESKPKPAIVESTVAEPETPTDEGTLAGKLNQKPIADLRSGIPLNEKFGFIRNLFANNASDYADAILKLNNFETAEQAIGYVAKLTDRKSWDVEDPYVKNFRSYVERRHLVASEANADQ